MTRRLAGNAPFLWLNPSIFQVSPARVAPMCQTGVMATSDSRRLEVKMTRRLAGNALFLWLNPGIFRLSPARVAPMCQTSVMATADSRRPEVK
jgi:hypothetical protein